MQKEYSIKDLSEHSGVKIQNIRIWEKRYNLFNPSRTSTNRRYYTDLDFEKITYLKFLIDKGYRISAISHFSLEELRNKSKEILQVSSKKNEEFSILITQLINGDLVSFNESLIKNLSDISPIDFIKDSLIPILQYLNILDYLYPLNNGNKLMTLHLIQKQLIFAAEQKSKKNNSIMNLMIVRPDLKTIPVSLCLVHFIATIKKYKSDIFLNYFNQRAFETLNRKLKPDIVYTEFNENQTFKEITDYLYTLESSFPMSKILVSGKTMLKYWKVIPNKVYFINSIEMLSRSL